MNLQVAYGLVSQALIAAAGVRIACELLPIRRPADARGRSAPAGASRSAGNHDDRGSDLPRGAAWAAMAGPLVLLMPAAGCTLAEHMRGIWGDPSIVTFAILAMFIARPARLPRRPSRVTSIGITLLVALPLYGPIFGLTLPLPDLYEIGWQPYALLVALALCAWLAWITGRWCTRWSTLLAIALLAYAVRVMESSNLLDYLADPGLLLTIAALAALPRTRAGTLPSQGHATHE